MPFHSHAYASQKITLVQLAVLALHIGPAWALKFSAIAEVFPELLIDFPNLFESPPTLTSRYSHGRQDFQKCCSLAVYESLRQSDDDGITLANPSFIGSDLPRFMDQQYPREQYPCGASYNGSKSGAPPGDSDLWVVLFTINRRILGSGVNTRFVAGTTYR